jgi:N-acyl-D-aspartate/D-glutamate deacylase
VSEVISMLDLLVTDGLVVDGTGATARRADIAVVDGRIVAIGEVGGRARRTIRADGQVVAPGFVDIHTHYDAQVFWDSTLSPSPLHGVTTAIGGNCGFSLAPLSTEDDEYLMRMLARVEGMPLDALEAGVPWDWKSTGDFLDRIDGTLAPNAGFLVGHSALRRAVLHEDASSRTATSDEIAAMQGLLRDGLRAGGMGLSSTWSRTHNDHEGHPVPSRHATREELLSLCAVVGEYPGTTLEFIPGVAPFDADQFRLMGVMSRMANRPLNWNVLHVYGRNADVVDHQLAGAHLASEEGGEVLALTLPDSFRTWLNFRSGFILDLLPGWNRLMALSEQEKLVRLSNPASRAEMDRLAQSAEGPTRSVANWAAYRIEESLDPSLVGRTVGEIGAERRISPWDALADVLVSDRLKTVITVRDRGQDDDSWRKRAEIWRDSRTVVGASDAGAHLDMIDSFSYATTLLARAVRERPLLGMEEAIHLLTDRPARLYGLRGRGRLAEGWWADLVLLDPGSVGPGPVYTRYDLPGGSGRIYGEAEGIGQVIVNGEVIVEDGQFNDARPGHLIRSGRDSETVTVI